MTEEELVRSAAFVAEALRRDSAVPLAESIPKVRRALEADGHPMTFDEARTFVMGDENGRVPSWMKSRWPNLDACLDMFF